MNRTALKKAEAYVNTISSLLKNTLTTRILTIELHLILIVL
nr:MAG TPA_asm: hypothetical protein [Bacteriophage sp.]